MAVAGFIAVYSFTYRGQPEEWSQGYHIADDWVDLAEFKAAMDDFRVFASNVVSDHTSFERFIGYHDFSPHHAHDYIYDVSSHGFVGAFDTTDKTQMPGDTAVWTRWNLARMSVKGKPVYLRKYWHDNWADEDGDHDTPSSAYRAALADFVTTARGGSWNGHSIADRLGATTTAVVGDPVSPWFTTRTLERRGRRHPPT